MRKVVFSGIIFIWYFGLPNFDFSRRSIDFRCFGTAHKMPSPIKSFNENVSALGCDFIAFCASNPVGPHAMAHIGSANKKYVIKFIKQNVKYLSFHKQIEMKMIEVMIAPNTKSILKPLAGMEFYLVENRDQAFVVAHFQFVEWIDWFLAKLPPTLCKYNSSMTSWLVMFYN